MTEKAVVVKSPLEPSWSALPQSRRWLVYFGLASTAAVCVGGAGWFYAQHLLWPLWFAITVAAVRMQAKQWHHVPSGHPGLALVAFVGFCWGLPIAVVSIFPQALVAGWLSLISIASLSLIMATTMGARPQAIRVFGGAACLAAILAMLFSATLSTTAAGAALVLANGLVFAAVLVAADGLQRRDDDIEQLRKTSQDLLDEERRVREEITFLQQEIKNRQHSEAQIADALDATSAKLALAKGRAESLTSMLDKIMPFESESGLLNAEKFQVVLEREWSRMQRQELPLTLLTMELDHFDEYRSANGESNYEVALRRMGEVLKRLGTRPGDVAARLAKNRFAVLLPEADFESADRLAETLRAQVRRLKLLNKHFDPPATVTASCGIATVIPNLDTPPDELLTRCESAVYEAAFQGGDRCVRFRTLPSFRLEKWNIDADGLLCVESLTNKLATWGYNATQHACKPGESMRGRRTPVDMVKAVIEGKLRVLIEGDEKVLGPGDCLFIPKGTVIGAEGVSETPVVYLQATRL